MKAKKLCNDCLHVAREMQLISQQHFEQTWGFEGALGYMLKAIAFED
jgi:hypothetical protein